MTALSKQQWTNQATGSKFGSNNGFSSTSNNVSSTDSGSINIQIQGHPDGTLRVQGDSVDYTPPCGYPTKDGDPCSLPGTRGENNRCHHHEGLIQDCGYPTKDGDPCELPGSYRRGCCHLHHDKCNESQKHDHLEKAAYHGMKSAYRHISQSSKGIVSDGYDSQHVWAAYHIAKGVALGYLESAGTEYDRDHSVDYYEDNILSKVDVPDDLDDGGFHWGGREAGHEDYYAEVLEKGISKAWKKIDSENHKGGARIAVSAVEHFMQEKLGVDA